jgi:hypothetical protein
VESTERLALPFILPGQAQKEMTHNEALQQLDVIVAGAVEEPPRNSPPGSPTVGSNYIVGSSPTGEWAAISGHLAAYTAAGLRTISPVEGMAVHVRSTGETALYRSGEWEVGRVRGSELVIDGYKVVGARSAAISTPAGGTVIDAEARAAISAILSALRGHGLVET